MKHRDRVLMSLEHEEPDRCPMYAGFTPEFRSRLRENMLARGWDLQGDDSVYEIERALDEDMLLTFVGWALSYYQEGDTYIDEWGIRWKSVMHQTRYGTGCYTEMIEHPLADERAIDSYQAPDPTRPELYADAERVLKQFKDEYWIVGAVVCTILEAAWGLRGLEAMLVDFASNPELADRILDIPYQYHLTAAKRLVEMGVDMLWIGDDVGTQHSMLISPKHWRRYLKPKMAELIAEVKAINPIVKVAYHSDGYLYPIIDDLIEIGLDVLNPIQPGSMSPSQLKEEFGERLCFWGSIDVQHTLPMGSPEQVKAEVLQRLRTIGRGGGLIIGPTHYVQLDTPMENFWAMVDMITQTPYRSLRN
jgi:uroporphyrinogen decarboxylase